MTHNLLNIYPPVLADEWLGRAKLEAMIRVAIRDEHWDWSDYMIHEKASTIWDKFHKTWGHDVVWSPHFMGEAIRDLILEYRKQVADNLPVIQWSEASDPTVW